MGPRMTARTVAYLIATVVIIIWGTTFISTKVLLEVLSPVEIMAYRYVLGYIALFVAYPRLHLPKSLKEELRFMSAGFFGGTLYFVTENYALKYTLASNVGLLVASAPIMTAVVARLVSKSERITRDLLWGFLVAFAGVFLVIFNGRFVLHLNPLGDVLALAAAASWAVYSILVRGMDRNDNGIFITRKIFFYSLLTMIPLLFVTDFRWSLHQLHDTKVVANLLFLGILASAVCFFLWSKVIWQLGPVRTNNFIYIVPLVTMLTSVIVLSEPLTVFAVTGGLLILGGVYLSSGGLRRKPGGKSTGA